MSLILARRIRQGDPCHYSWSCLYRSRCSSFLRQGGYQSEGNVPILTVICSELWWSDIDLRSSGEATDRSLRIPWYLQGPCLDQDRLNLGGYPGRSWIGEGWKYSLQPYSPFWFRSSCCLRWGWCYFDLPLRWPCECAFCWVLILNELPFQIDSWLVQEDYRKDLWRRWRPWCSVC